MNQGYVILHGKKIFIRDNALRLKDKGIRNILELKGLEIQSYLEVLNLIDNKISDIIGLEKLTNLKHLDLSYNQIKEIKGLENLTSLNYLNLDSNQIIEIKGLDNLANLQELKLSKNRIREIKGLEKLQNLKRIDLSHNEILDEERVFLDQEISVLLKYCLNKSVQQESEKKFVESAKELYRKQKYQDSINLFEKALVINPRNVKVLIYLGSAYGKLGRFSESIMYFQRVIDIDRTQQEAWKNLGVSYKNLKMYQEAFKCFIEAFKLKPQDSACWKHIEELKKLMEQKEIPKSPDQGNSFESIKNSKDPYEIFNLLGKRLTLNYFISRETEFSEIQKIWRVLIKFFHPDTNPFVNEEITKIMNNAFEKIKKERNQ